MSGELKDLEKRVDRLESMLTASGIIRKADDAYGGYLNVNVQVDTQRSTLDRLMDELGYETIYVSSQPSYTEVVKKKPVRKRKAR